jgi:hypothetical protein
VLVFVDAKKIRMKVDQHRFERLVTFQFKRLIKGYAKEVLRRKRVFREIDEYSPGSAKDKKNGVVVKTLHFCKVLDAVKRCDTEGKAVGVWVD